MNVLAKIIRFEESAYVELWSIVLCGPHEERVLCMNGKRLQGSCQYLLSVPFQCGIACSYAVWAISNNFTLFVISRIIGGVSKGNISLSTAVVTDVCSSKIRGKGMVSILCFDHLKCSFFVPFFFFPHLGTHHQLLLVLESDIVMMVTVGCKATKCK